MSGEWQCPGCDYETEALCDDEHVYDCLCKAVGRIAELEKELEVEKNRRVPRWVTELTEKRRLEFQKEFDECERKRKLDVGRRQWTCQCGFSYKHPGG